MSRFGGVPWAPRRAAALGLVGFSLIVVAACSNGASIQGGGGGTAGQPAGGANGGPPRAAASAAPTAAPTAAPDAQGGNGATGQGSSGDGSGETGGNAPFSTDQLIVRTGTLALQVTNIDTSLLSARAKIIGFGGYVSDSQQTNTTDEDAMALITYRIPAARWEDALDALRGIASKVLAENTQAV